MTDTRALAEGSWVPRACTLPTAEQPLRLAEFDELFASAVIRVESVDTSRVHLELRPEPTVAAGAAELMVRETGCCSFFTFSLTATGGQLALDVALPAGHADVLDALTARAAAGGQP
ncbi:hypothetical protein [Plantactinospora sp. KLBMP9567]|uniref:hypothetical protein n=1 Tax=Plantactinospora sp. KLBMP9567 TaxID=3085900 RepID=UPI002980E467|nr:hypothetical protein [Plantactinospora sp. KLBMP9567]MDW5329646.1 hypothetical protein [Plantactinospora sp. KLBMP9567]